MADHNGNAQPAVAHEASAGELVKQLSEQVSQLIRDELKLAEYEMTRKAKGAARGAGMFGGSGLLALYACGCLLAAAIIGLAGVHPGLGGGADRGRSAAGCRGPGRTAG